MMIKTILILLLLCTWFNAISQELHYSNINSKETELYVNKMLKYTKRRHLKDSANYAVGYILKNNEKKFCLIYNGLIKNNTIYIIANFLNDSSIVYTADEIDGYTINNENYVSYRTSSQSYFLRIVENGRVLLFERGYIPSDQNFVYFLKLKGQDYFNKIELFKNSISKSNNDIQEIFNFESKQSKIYQIQTDKLEQFLLAMPDLCDIVKNKIRSRFYTPDNFVLVLHEYNICNPDSEQVKFKKYELKEDSKNDSIRIYSRYGPRPPEEPLSPDTVFKYVKGVFRLVGGLGGGRPTIYQGDLAKINNEFGDSIENIKSTTAFHFLLSPRYNFLLTKRVRLQTGIDFSVLVEDMLVKRKNTNTDSISVNLNSIGLPICFLIRILNKPTSPTISVGFTPRIIGLGWKSDLNLKKFDASLDIGIGFDRMTTYRWNITELKFSFGLINLSQSNSKIIYNSLIEKMYYSTITLVFNVW